MSSEKQCHSAGAKYRPTADPAGENKPMLGSCWINIEATLVNRRMGAVDPGVTSNLFCFDVTVVDVFSLHLLGVPALVGPLEAGCTGPTL